MDERQLRPRSRQRRGQPRPLPRPRHRPALAQRPLRGDRRRRLQEHERRPQVGSFQQRPDRPEYRRAGPRPEDADHPLRGRHPEHLQHPDRLQDDRRRRQLEPARVEQRLLLRQHHRRRSADPVQRLRLQRRQHRQEHERRHELGAGGHGLAPRGHLHHHRPVEPFGRLRRRAGGRPQDDERRRQLVALQQRAAEQPAGRAHRRRLRQHVHAVPELGQRRLQVHGRRRQLDTKFKRHGRHPAPRRRPRAHFDGLRRPDEEQRLQPHPPYLPDDRRRHQLGAD